VSFPVDDDLVPQSIDHCDEKAIVRMFQCSRSGLQWNKYGENSSIIRLSFRHCVVRSPLIASMAPVIAAARIAG
jgi:hypothetical protein